MPLLLLGELGCERNSPSHRRSDPVKGHSKSVQEPPFPEFGHGSWVLGSSRLDWVVGSGYAEEWALLGDRGRLEWDWTSFGLRKVP